MLPRPFAAFLTRASEGGFNDGPPKQSRCSHADPFSWADPVKARLVMRPSGEEFALLRTAVHDGRDGAALMQRMALAPAAPQGLASSHKAGGVRRGSKGGGLDEPRLLACELRQALVHRSLALHYQPLYGADGITLHGYEALARWPHPRRGFVPPSEFIAVAEAHDMIDELGRWVLRQACAEAARWPVPLRVAVNLSAAQFRKEGTIVHEVARALAETGLAPSRLELEITESLLMDHGERTLRSLGMLQSMGVRIAIDDFGTGYSNLACLWRFPFDKVKIDRAFTQNLHSGAKVGLVVKAIVSLAHSLDIRVNAEGVETAAQVALLREHGCDELQGFLLGRPAPPAGSSLSKVGGGVVHAP
jgi:EAL domain-containing protein (putative c-di-GMP-specific phosphodiesterase class I)